MIEGIGSTPDFHTLSHPQEVIFASGAIDQSGDIVDRNGWRRIVLLVSHSGRAGGHAGALERILGKRLVTTYDTVQQHVQDVQVDEIIASIKGETIDAVIGLGGGSPVGMAKAVASGLNEKQRNQSSLSTNSQQANSLAVIAIPTTYAGSEMTPVFGITRTREVPRRKVTVSDPAILPRVVIYDPQLTLDLPPEVTASTGINALAHCIEALYSSTRNPLSSAAALSGIRTINRALLACYRQGNNLAARSEMLVGSYLAGTSLASASMGLHHGLCHVLGGTAKVPHGIANAIVLPHVMRFNAKAAAMELLPAALALGIEQREQLPEAVVEAAAEKVAELVKQMGLPQRLREVGVREADLSNLAQIAYSNKTVMNNPRRITDAGQIEELLREMW